MLFPKIIQIFLELTSPYITSFLFPFKSVSSKSSKSLPHLFLTCCSCQLSLSHYTSNSYPGYLLFFDITTTFASWSYPQRMFSWHPSYCTLLFFYLTTFLTELSNFSITSGLYHSWCFHLNLLVVTAQCHTFKKVLWPSNYKGPLFSGYLGSNSRTLLTRLLGLI